MKLVITTILLSACATTGGISSPEPAHTSGVILPLDPALRPSDEAKPWFPGLATKAALPTAQRLRTELFSTGRDVFAMGVRVCVAPDGSTASVSLAESSGIAALDQAALHDIAGWRYEQFAASARVQVCKPLAIQYRTDGGPVTKVP